MYRLGAMIPIGRQSPAIATLGANVRVGSNRVADGRAHASMRFRSVPRPDINASPLVPGCEVPQADSCAAANSAAPLFDHLVGAQHQRAGDLVAHRLCGL